MNMLMPVNGYLTQSDMAKLKAEGVTVAVRDHDALPPEALEMGVPFAYAADEPDNAQRGEDGGFLPCLSPEEQAEEAAALRAKFNRPVFRNFGRGMVKPEWAGRGSCQGMTDDYYLASIASADVVAFDYYPVTSDEGRLERVAEGTRALGRYITLGGGGQTQWTIIEAAQNPDGVFASPDQIRSMVWMSITNGARGIVFFPWQVTMKGERVREDGSFAIPGLAAGLRSITGEVQALAPVIKGGAPVALEPISSAPISSAAFRKEDDLFIFAVSERADPAEVRFSLPFSGGGTAQVLGEASTIALTDTGLSDRIDGYGVRLYLIAGAYADANRVARVAASAEVI